MMMPLTRRKTSWAAYCDACLIGSPAFVFDAPHLARTWAANRLRLLGWTHVPPRDLPLTGHGQAHADSSWTGQTFCFECSTNTRMRITA